MKRPRFISPSPEETIEWILSLDEDQHFEFKRAGKNERPVETAVAFANASGGVIFLGVEDPKKAKGRDRLFGIEENPEAVDQLRGLIRTRITPLLAPPLVEDVAFREIPCVLRNGKPGHIGLIHVN